MLDIVVGIFFIIIGLCPELRHQSVALVRSFAYKESNNIHFQVATSISLWLPMAVPIHQWKMFKKRFFCGCLSIIVFKIVPKTKQVNLRLSKIADLTLVPYPHPY